MRRVLCCFTRGLNEEDFIKPRWMARNFRAYFAGLRAEHVKKLQNLRPRPHPPNYSTLKVAALKRELDTRKLSTKGSKSDLINRLEKHDAEKNNEALDSLLDSVSQSHMNSQGSSPALSVWEPKNFKSYLIFPITKTCYGNRRLRAFSKGETESRGSK